MANYSGFEPQRPFGSFIAGMGAADQMRHTALKNDAMQAAIDQQKRQRETAEQFAATGDPRELRGYDPALAVSIENSLATMDSNKKEAAIKRLTAAIDLTGKAAPYIVAAAKSNPQAAANMYPEYVADIENLGIQLPAFLKQYSPDALESVLKYNEDLKTIVARINAASRDRQIAGRQATDIYKADRGYEGKIDSAKIIAAGPGGRGGTGSTRFPSYLDYKKDVRDGKIPNIPADADEDTMIRGFNAANSGGKAAGQAEYPKPPKPLTPTEQFMDKALNPERQGTVGQPSAGVPKTVRPHVVRNKQGQDVTNQLSDAEYQQILKAKGLR